MPFQPGQVEEWAYKVDICLYIAMGGVNGYKSIVAAVPSFV